MDSNVPQIVSMRYVEELMTIGLPIKRNELRE